jgi:hypothetical protein
MATEKKEFSGEVQGEEFSIRILKDMQNRSEVVFCKVPTMAPIAISFDFTVTNVGEKDVRIHGTVQRIRKSDKR